MLLLLEGSRTCLIGEGLARDVRSRFGYTPINIFLFFRKLSVSWKGGILAMIDLRHGAAEAQPAASNHTRDTGRQAPDARNTSLVCDSPEQKSARRNNTWSSRVLPRIYPPGRPTLHSSAPHTAPGPPYTPILPNPPLSPSPTPSSWSSHCLLLPPSTTSRPTTLHS